VQSVTAEGVAKSDALVFCSSADTGKKRELEARGVQVEQIAADTIGRPDIHAILQQLGKREITSLMIEGGSAVNGMALAAGVVDKAFLYYAPKIMAAEGAVPFAIGAHFREMDQIPQLKQLHLHRFGDDFAVEGYLRDPYGG
jgi:diaminohydroxyphosphoribosylaminopyrimidine deaminase/5-amino-6-(5-phosphoribosylamino)uracil reductase